MGIECYNSHFQNTFDLFLKLNIYPKNSVQTLPVYYQSYIVQRLSNHQLLDSQQTVLFTRLSGGMTNQVWLLTQGNIRLVLKMYENNTTSENPLYPNLPEIESRIMSYFAASHFMTPLLQYWPEVWNGERVFNAALVYEYIEGAIWQSGTDIVAKLLSKVHDSVDAIPPAWLRDLPLSASDVCAHADSILGYVSLAPEFMALKKLRPVSPSSKILTQKSIVHGDCWAGNFIQHEKRGLYLIDWQCPGIGDAVEDIANFLSPGMMSFCREHSLTVAERQAFFDAYENKAVIARYLRDASSWHWRLACYYLYRRERLKGTALSLGYQKALMREMAYLSE